MPLNNSLKVIKDRAHEFWGFIKFKNNLILPYWMVRYDKSEPNSPLNWLIYLNPGPKEIAPGVVVGSCFEWCPKAQQYLHNDKVACGYELAYGVAKYILEGSDIESEKEELLRFLKSEFIGKKVVTLDTRVEILSLENLETYVDSVIQRGTRILDATVYFSTHSKPFTPEAIAILPATQKQVTEELYEINRRINQIRPGVNAQPLIEQMQNTLKRAIDVGLGEYGLIIRHSVAYGVGNYLRKKLSGSQIAAFLEATNHN